MDSDESSHTMIATVGSKRKMVGQVFSLIHGLAQLNSGKRKLGLMKQKLGACMTLGNCPRCVHDNSH